MGSGTPLRGAAVALAALLAALIAAVPALGHGGNPNFRSEVTAIEPSVPGLEVSVLNYDDRLLMINRTGSTVLVQGYEGEPYLRIRADGAVEVNRRSPSFYVSRDRYGVVQVPREARSDAAPRWQVVSRTGRYEWHDHRIHYMSKASPPQVTDSGERTKIFDWKVPVTVGARKASLEGRLLWEPDSPGGAPRGAIIVFAAFFVLTATFMAVTTIRRRRASAAGGAGTKRSSSGGRSNPYG
jgi:hypothetical protein